MTFSHWRMRVRRWRPIVALAVLGALLGLAAGAVVSAAWPRTYVAQARVMMATPEWNDSTATAGGGGDQTATTYGDQFTQQRMPTYQELVGTARVLTPAAADVGLTPERLGARISSRLVPDTVLLEVTARETNPQRAADEANAVARRLVESIEDLERSTPNAVSPIQPVLVNGATAPARASSPHIGAVLASGAALGLALALTVEVVRRRGRARLDFADGGPRLGGLPVLGVLGLDEDADAECRARVARDRGESTVRVLALVPVDSGPDATTAASRLAAAFADIGSRVCVIDDAESARTPGYYGSAVFRSRLRAAADDYDEVLVATRPVGRGASALDVGRAASATLLLAAPDCADAELTAAQADLAACGIEPLGVLLVERAARRDGGDDGIAAVRAGPPGRNAEHHEKRKATWN